MGQASSGIGCASGEEEDDAELEASSSRRSEDADCTSLLPDECLAWIFHKMSSSDRNHCSLVCKRWLYVEGQARQRLTLLASAEIHAHLPALFARFDHLSKLSLRCDRKTASISDKSLFLVGRHCLHLRKLKLKGCRQITDDGLEIFSKVCGSLSKLSCGSCSFGARGLNSILRHCTLLEDLTVKRLRGLGEGPGEPIGPGVASIKRLCLKELFNAQLFGPLIAGSKSLHTLMICRNSGNWDKLLEIITEHLPNLVELHMERLHLSDNGLRAASRCTHLEVLHVAKTPECTNYGLSVIAESCNRLKKLHVDGWKSNRIGDAGLIAVAKNCKELQELVLIGIDATAASLGVIASNCLGLERLAVCNSETVGDAELSCIAAKCHSLKRLCIRGCPISDQGMKALVSGCPHLIKVKAKKCREVTVESAAWLKVHRPALVVSLDLETAIPQSDEIARVTESATTSAASQEVSIPPPTTPRTRSPFGKIRLAFVASGSFVAGSFLRRSSRNSSSV